MRTLGKEGLGSYLFMETMEQFEKHMEIYHPEKYIEIKGISQ